MNNHVPLWTGVVARAIIAALLVFPLLAQAPNTKRKAPDSTSISRAPDGHPELQGIWTNATITPLERPAEFPGRASITDNEAAVFEKRALDNSSLDRRDGGSGKPTVGGYNNLFVDKGTELARVDGEKRTSLIVDPPDGKIPPMTPDGHKRVANLRLRADEGGGGGGGDLSATINRGDVFAATGGISGTYDSIKDRPLSERCILGFGSTSGPPMMPVLYNNTYEIVQTPGAIMILVEMVHDIRVIHMDGRPHLPSSVRQWLGDSIGHWEGDTLVVETTNFTDQTTFYGSDQNLKVIERFRRVDAQTMLYRVTIDDPTSFAKPWTLEYPFLATAGPVYEYACHEGNYAMPDILGGARRQEKLAGETEK